MTSDFSEQINRIFADAYHGAALLEADMPALVAVLEPIRGSLKENGDTLATRAALDTAAGGNDDLAAEAALLQLRTDFTALQKRMWAAELEQARQRSPEEAWTLFLNRYAEAMYYWRTQLMWWWADTAAGATPEAGKPEFEDKTEEQFRIPHSAFRIPGKPLFEDKTEELERFREQSRLIEHGRWPEAYPFLRELSEHPSVMPKLRAQLRTVCGSIQMHFNTLPDARNDLAEAEKIYPDLQYLPVCKADLERVAGNPAQSRAILERHLAMYPRDAEAYIACGRSYLEENNPDEAGRWFDKAIATDPGNASAYRNKMSLYGKDAEGFKKNKVKIGELRQLADRADPESALSNLLEAGYTFQAGGDLNIAALCFERARQADPERLEPIVAEGLLLQQQKQWDRSRACYEEVLRLAPGAVDGYWNLAAWNAEQGNYREAAAWYEKALPNCPMFTRTLLVKAGEMYIAAGDFEKALSSCLQSLERDPDFDFALNTLHDLSDKLRDKGYDDKTGTEPALGVLHAIRRIKGETYEAGYQNRAGNVYYYFADYATAAGHYRKAIAADAGVAVYHDNLAGALDKLFDQSNTLELLREALQAAQNAARLEPGNESYRQQSNRLERKLVSVRHFGVLPDERSAHIYAIRVRFRDELYPWLVKDDNLVPALLKKIEDMRERFRQAFGIALPGVRFSTDWNIVEGANYVIDLDGIPMQQGWLHFDESTAENTLGELMAALEQNILYNLADFVHYDSPEIASKFAGKSAAHASGFFQLVRMLLKQKISVAQIDTIHEIYESGLRAGRTVQAIAEELRRHPALLPHLPVNTAASRTFDHLSAEQEDEVLASVGKSKAGQLLWQIRPNDPAFSAILEYLPKSDFVPGGAGHFITTRYPQVATLLNDLQPGTFFSRAEILHLSDAEKAAMPTP